jgi:hypothetical protein
MSQPSLLHTALVLLHRSVHIAKIVVRAVLPAATSLVGIFKPVFRFIGGFFEGFTNSVAFSVPGRLIGFAYRSVGHIALSPLYAAVAIKNALPALKKANQEAKDEASNSNS